MLTMKEDSAVATASAEMMLTERIEKRQARVGVIGLGYVGLPLAVEFAQAGFHVTGFDVHLAKVNDLNRGESYIQDVPTAVVKELVDSGHLRATADLSELRDMDTVNICVPTPLRKTKDPDMSFVVAACDELVRYIHPGMLIILESTTYPGTTNELLMPMLEKSGLKTGEDFFLCFSPERVDPGNAKYHTKNIPKVIGGITPACTRVGALLYGAALDTVVPVSSTSVAEMVKLLENTFRMINIGLANEMAMMCLLSGACWEFAYACKELQCISSSNQLGRTWTCGLNGLIRNHYFKLNCATITSPGQYTATGCEAPSDQFCYQLVTCEGCAPPANQGLSDTDPNYKEYCVKSPTIPVTDDQTTKYEEKKPVPGSCTIENVMGSNLKRRSSIFATNLNR